MKARIIIALAAIFLIAVVLKNLNLNLNFIDNKPTVEEAKAHFLNYFKKESPSKWAGIYFDAMVSNVDISQLTMGDSIKKSNGGTLPAPYNMDSNDCWPVAFDVVLSYVRYGKTLNTPSENIKATICKAYSKGDLNVYMNERLSIIGR